jgi:hypothetical protein
MLGVAVVLSAIYLWKFRTPSTPGYVIIGIAYALMFVALFIDFTRVRPAIKAAQRGQASSAARSKTDKSGRGERSAGSSSAKAEAPSSKKKGDSASQHGE